MKLSEQELVRQLKAGSDQAVADWFGQYHDKLFRLVVAKVSDKADAQELVQEIFLNCLKNLNLYRGDAKLWTWMYSVARHEIADYFRKKYAKRALATLPLAQWLVSDEVKVHDSHEVSQKVRSVLERMNGEYRELLLLKYVDGKKVKKIARDLDRSIKAVESDLFRARNEFRELWVLDTE